MWRSFVRDGLPNQRLQLTNRVGLDSQCSLNCGLPAVRS